MRFPVKAGRFTSWKRPRHPIARLNWILLNNNRECLLGVEATVWIIGPRTWRKQPNQINHQSIHGRVAMVEWISQTKHAQTECCLCDSFFKFQNKLKLTEAGQVTTALMCVRVCVCVWGSGTVRARVLPLEQICGLLGQTELSIASKDTAHCTSGQHDIGRALFWESMLISQLPWRYLTDNFTTSTRYPSQCSTPSSPPPEAWLQTCPVLGSGWGGSPHSHTRSWTENSSRYRCDITSCFPADGWCPRAPLPEERRWAKTSVHIDFARGYRQIKANQV